MKKRPILLATLSLGAALLPATMPLNVLAADARPLEDALSTEVGVFNPFLGVYQIHFDNPSFPNRLYIDNDSRTTNEYLRRYIIAYFDYENGVTEQEADRNLASLGNEDATGWKILEDHQPNQNYVQLNGITTTRTLNGQNSGNKTGILYYAAQYGRRTRTAEEDGYTWSELRWVRGKVNYRGCLQVAGFDYNENYCAARKNYATMDLKYYMDDRVAPVEEPTSWNTEWLEIQAERLRTLQADWQTLKTQLEAGELAGATEAEAALTGIGGRIAQLRQTLAKTYFAADLRAEIEVLKAEVAAVSERLGWTVPEMGPEELATVNDDDLKPAKPDPAEPAEPTELVEQDPVTPVDPVNPVEPVEPTDPIDPVEPGGSDDPEDPEDPAKPIDPVNPVEPVEPTKPGDPTEDPSGTGEGSDVEGPASGATATKPTVSEQAEKRPGAATSDVTGGSVTSTKNESAVVGRSDGKTPENGSGESTGDNKQEQFAVKTPNTEEMNSVPEVPNLGGEAQKATWWLWLVPGAVVLLALGAIWRRRQQKQPK